MGAFYFERGLVIQREGRLLEYQHQSDTAMYFEDPATRDVERLTKEEFLRAYATKEITIVKARSSDKELDVPTETAALIALPEKYQSLHLRRLEYARGVRLRGVGRGQLTLIAEAIREIAKERNDEKLPSASTVAWWMRELERANGDDTALVPKSGLKPKRTRTSEDDDALIDEVLDNHLSATSKFIDIYNDHYVPALEEANAERARSKQPLLTGVSSRTFYRRIKTIDKYEIDVIRLGRQEARRLNRMIKGHMPGTRPLDYIEIDHALLKLWVVDDLLMLPLGRPWITAVRDRVTGMLLGFYVTFRAPSLASAFGAIRYSLTPHLDFKKIWPDLENDWFAFGLGEIYVSDRAAEFISERYRYGIHRLGGHVGYCPSRTPWHKPHIERLFLSVYSELLESMPGQVFKGLTYSRDYNPKRDAVVRFSTLIYLLVKWAVDVHPFKKRRGRGARAIDLWHDGILDAPPGHIPDPDALRIVLGLPEKGMLGHEGVRYRHLNYANDQLEDLYRSVHKAQVEFVVHEENLGRIHVADPRTREWFEVPCTRPDYAEGLSLYQHQCVLRETRKAGEAKDDVDRIQRFRSELETRIADDLTRRESAKKLELARYCGIDSTAVFAGKGSSIASLTDTGRAALPARPVLNSSPFIDVPHFGWSAP